MAIDTLTRTDEDRLSHVRDRAHVLRGLNDRADCAPDATDLMQVAGTPFG
jgi:hypothetical protein